MLGVTSIWVAILLVRFPCSLWVEGQGWVMFSLCSKRLQKMVLEANRVSEKVAILVSQGSGYKCLPAWCLTRQACVLSWI